VEGGDGLFADGVFRVLELLEDLLLLLRAWCFGIECVFVWFFFFGFFGFFGAGG